MTLGGLVAKKMEEALRMPKTRSCQRAEPLVCGEKSVSTCLSALGSGNAYIVVHDRSSKQEDSCIVGPLDPIDVAAIESCMGTIVEVIVLVHQTDSLSPIKCLLRPLRISIVARIQSQSSPQVEETTVGDGVFVIVSSVESENLPSQTAITILIVPPARLIVENRLCQG